MPTFHIRGRFQVPTKPSKLIDKSKLSNFWQASGGLNAEHGCYIFSLSKTGGEKPWYVGKASSTTFSVECFSAHKLIIYTEALVEQGGVPYLTFLTPAKTKGPTPLLAIDEVEEYLIGNAASRNPYLANKRRLPNQKWSIASVTKPTKGAPPHPVTSFKKLMGIK